MPRPALLHRYAAATAVATFLLLIAGGTVTSTDSGLAVPDWPLSYGTWFPPMVGGILYEHGHRMVAAAVGLMILILAVWLSRAEPRQWVRRLGWAALGAVVLQGLLGGLTVLLLLPPQVSIAHACLGQGTFCLVAALAMATAPRWIEQPARITGEPGAWLRILTAAAAGLAIAQLLLGAIVRHTGWGVAVHVAGAVWLVLTIGLIGWRLRHARAARMLRAHWARLALLVGLQASLGVAVLWHRTAAPLRTAHVAIGALVLAQSVMLAWLARRWITPVAARRERIAALLELTKPRLTSLVLVTTAAGFWLARPDAGSLGQGVVAVLATALVAGGANALNEWLERDADALMRRTSMRPIPSGRVTPQDACAFGLALVAAGLTGLLAFVNPLAAGLAAASAASYVLLYTPLKSRTSLCTLVGAVPGALPPVIGWAAARGTLSLEAWVLFLLLFVWQLPHFLAIAVLYREDYARAGMRMLPVTERDGTITARQTVLYGLTLLPLSVFPSVIGLAGPWYFLGALVLSATFLGMAVRTAVAPSTPNARWLFRSSILYLPLVLLLLVADRAVAMTVHAGSGHRPASAMPALPVLGALPDFALTDHEGRPVSRQTLQGRVWVADFIFTRCAGQCPMMHARMQELQTAFAGRPGLELVSFTVDPAYDTRDVLAAFAGRVGAQPGRWRFVTGPPQAIEALARDGFRVGAGSDGPPEEPITHSVRLILVDHRGRVRGMYDASEPGVMQRLQADALSLLREVPDGA